jgi:hypothetical protein
LEYLRELSHTLLQNFLSFFYFPYTTSYILSFILWFPLIILVPSLGSGDFNTLSPYLNSCTDPCSHLLVLYITNFNSSFNYLLLYCILHTLLQHMIPLQKVHMISPDLLVNTQYVNFLLNIYIILVVNSYIESDLSLFTSFL